MFQIPVDGCLPCPGLSTLIANRLPRSLMEREVLSQPCVPRTLFNWRCQKPNLQPSACKAADLPSSYGPFGQNKSRVADFFLVNM